MIPFLDLRAQYSSIKDEIQQAVTGVFESGQFVLGEDVAAFESEFARYVVAAHGIAVNTGTSALHLALLAAGVGPGDEVITVPFTFVATVAAICYTGARPVFVDVDPRSFTLDVAQLEAAITPKTKAILPVHIYGQPADMDPILAIARERNLIRSAADEHKSRLGAIPADEMREWAGNQLLNLTPDEFINDPTVIRLIESGSPGDVIADVASEVGADLTILGTHEYGTVHKHLIGTTTDKLLTKTSTPVLTVKL